VVARKRDGKFEQAYGHHRIEAARQVLGKNASVRLIIRDLDDETMLKMMAADNDDAYNLSPGFILETVESALGFLKLKSHNVVGNKRGVGPEISKIIDWPVNRVESALAQHTGRP
jgi:hypothetical protein